VVLAPEMRQSGGRSVLGRADAKLFADALTKKFVHGGNAGFAIELDEGAFLGHDLEFPFNHGLVADEGPVEIVRERHVAARFPVADGLGFLEFAGERSFGADIEPESNMRAERHGVETGEVIAIDAADDTSSDQRKDESIGEDNSTGAQRGNDAVLQLVEEIGGIHQSESEAGDSVFRKEFVNVAAHEVGAAESAGLNGKAFRFEPFLEKSDLRGTTRAVHSFQNDECAAEFAWIEAHEGFAEERLGIFRIGGHDLLMRGSRLARGDNLERFLFVLVGHATPLPGGRAGQIALDQFWKRRCRASVFGAC